MNHRHLLLVIGMVCLGAGEARAGEHDGWAVGGRAEGPVYGVGADHWSGRLGLTATAGGSLSQQRESAPDYPTTELRATAVGGSAGGLVALFEGPRARLALGARAVYLRWHGSYGGDAGFTYQQVALQVPLRIQLWVSDRVALHTEVGLELGLAGNRATAAGGAPAGDGDSRYLSVFGHPLGNVGVSYCF